LNPDIYHPHPNPPPSRGREFLTFHPNSPIEGILDFSPEPPPVKGEGILTFHPTHTFKGEGILTFHPTHTFKGEGILDFSPTLAGGQFLTFCQSIKYGMIISGNG
jgi:hypothetical protein